MIPRLIAEENLRARTTVATGTGAFKPEDTRRIVSDWQTAANGGTRPRRSRRPQSAAELAEAGFGVTVVEGPSNG